MVGQRFKTADPSLEDVVAIARGLTDQMRQALTWPKEARIIPETLWAGTVAGLDRRGLIARTYSLTPLGIRVRDLLTAGEGRDDHDS